MTYYQHQNWIIARYGIYMTPRLFEKSKKMDFKNQRIKNEYMASK
jgi:hypothetical protein